MSSDLLNEIRRARNYAAVLEAMRSRRSTAAEDLWGASAPLLLSALAEDLGGVGLCILTRGSADR